MKQLITLNEWQLTDKSVGFTLAEVLITLVIIGVIAALTIPTLMQNMNEKATVTKLKKAFTTLNNATLAAVAENGSIDAWGLTGSNGAPSVAFNNSLKPYLKVIKDCGTEQHSACWTDATSQYLKGGNWTSFNTDTKHAKMVLADGIFLATWVWNNYCSDHSRTDNTGIALYNVCGQLYIDINGYKGENTNGKDIFKFWITKDGQMIPGGTPEDKFSLTSNCSMNAAGDGCAAWVIYKENMDYLKGKTVAW